MAGWPQRHVRRAYAADVRVFLAHAGKPLRAVTVGDVQAFGASLEGMASASRARKLSVVKSLLAYAHRLGYVPFNTGAPVKLPSVKATLAERISAAPGQIRLLLPRIGKRKQSERKHEC